MKPKIKISLIEQKGHMGCHRGHQIGDTFDFDTERGNLCPMAMHVAFPYIDILRYGGKLPGQPDGSAVFCCPDVDVTNVFKIEIIEAALPHLIKSHISHVCWNVLQKFLH